MNLTLRQANKSNEHQFEVDAPAGDRLKKTAPRRRASSKQRASAPQVSLAAKIRETGARTDALCHVLGKLRPGPKFDAMEKDVEALHNEIRELEAQIPNPPQSFMDLVVRAEIARFGADRNKSGEMAELTSEDVFEGPAARLIDAVIQFGEGDTSRK
jgi:hypothetical protein